MPSLSELRAELDAAREQLRAAVCTVSHDTLFRRPPGEPTPDDERWPVADVLWHVLDAERRWRRWIEEELGGPPMGTTERTARPAMVDTLDSLLAEFESDRALTLGLFARLGDAGDAWLDQARPAPRDYVRTVRDALAHLAVHDRLHIPQIRELLRTN